MASAQQQDSEDTHEKDTKKLESQPVEDAQLPKGRKLSFDEASLCLNTLGKDETGIRYAYLMITATDRQLSDISVVVQFKHVLFLDLSFNRLTLKALQVLVQMPFLIYLKANNNNIESAALDELSFLQVLVLNRNKILETLDINQPMLETIDIEHNQLYSAKFVEENVPNLKYLNLKGNHLVELSDTFPKTLEKLYITDNLIHNIQPESLSRLQKLTHLHLRDNQIRKLDGFTDALQNLTYLNLRNNKISKFREFRKLKCLPKLTTLIVTGNPVTVEKEEEPLFPAEDDDYLKAAVKVPFRISILVLLPKLKRINKDAVSIEELDQSLFVGKCRYAEIMEELSSDEEFATTVRDESYMSTDTSEFGSKYGEYQGEDYNRDNIIRDINALTASNDVQI